MTTSDEFAALRPQWEALYESSPTATPFLSHDWLASYWSSFGDADSLRVVCVRDDGGRLTGAAALRLRRRHGVRTLTPVGAEITDFSDVLLDAAVPQAGALLAAALLELPGWGALDLPEVPPDAQAWQLLTNWPGQSFVRPASTCLELPVLPTETLLAALTPKHRQLVRRNSRLGLRSVVVGTEPEQLTKAVGELLDLHRREWQGRNGNGLHETEAFHRHLVGAVQRLAPQGRATLTRHLLNDELAAVSMTLHAPGLVAGYLSGTEPALRKQIDISALLIESGLALGRDRGAERLSLLRGQESGKLRWHPQERRSQRLLLLRPEVGGGHCAAALGVLTQASRARLGRSAAVRRMAGWLLS
ncbi:MAG TPA: GNAT family N-acetyltransferase [Actinoplanes sp.]|nr:GNAT family N-acetyltransferase [Actinoplanes sp.]